MTTTFTETFLDETRRDPRRARRRQRRGGRRRPRRRARPGRAAVHPRRRRLGRARRPRRQRLPQAVRVRGLRPHRQRVRAHRPHQRRGLGHGVLGLARGLAPRGRRRPADLLGRRRRRSSATSRPTSCGPSSWRRRSAPACTASSAATAATRPRPPTLVRRDPAAGRRAHHAPHRGPVRRGVAPAGQPPGPAARRPPSGRPSPGSARWHIVSERFFIVGGAGFIGSHFTDRLLGRPRRRARSPSTTTTRPAGAGTTPRHDDDPRFAVVEGEVDDLEALRAAMDGHDTVIHLASNPDIAAAVTNPAIDFDQGTALTNNVVEAMRTTSALAPALRVGQRRLRRPRRPTRPSEDHGPLVPTSTYGASQAGGRGAHRVLRGHVRPHAPACSASATWSAPARPTASASTSCAAC